MASTLDTLKAASQLVKQAFGTDYVPNRKEIAFLKGQLREVIREVKERPELLAKAVEETRTAADAISLASDIVSDGRIEFREKGSRHGRRRWSETIESARKIAQEKSARLGAARDKLTSRIGDLQGLLDQAGQGTVDPQAVNEAVDRLLDDLLPPENEAEAAGEEEFVTAGPEVARDRPFWVTSFTPSWEMSGNTALTPGRTSAPILESAPTINVEPVISRDKMPAGSRSTDDGGLIVDRFLLRRIAGIMGKEVSPLKINMILSALIRYFDSPSTGILATTCVDETETDSRIRMARGPIARFLPPLTGGARSPMMSVNIGGLFVPETLAIAEDHFGIENPLTLLVKIQSHCGVVDDGSSRRYGEIDRYGVASRACAALGMVMRSELDLGAAREIHEGIEPELLNTFREDKDGRGQLLLSAQHVRLQLDRADRECCARPRGNIYIMFGTVNLNGLASPAEFPVILRVRDRRGPTDVSWENCLGDVN